MAKKSSRQVGAISKLLGSFRANGPSAPQRSRFGILLFVVLLIALGWWGVHTIRERVESAERFLVEPGQIHYTPEPIWISKRLLPEVIQIAGWKQPLSTMQRGLSVKIRNSFALHPWIRQVTKVRITPPRMIEVELEYREPVAIVRTGKTADPIDQDGVLLPTEGLQNREIYLSIVGVRSTPMGPAGTKWDDDQVIAGAKTASVLSPQHRKLGVDTVDVGSYTVAEKPASTLYLVTHQGKRIKWGLPPGTSGPEEVSVEDKLARLRKLHQRGLLDSIMPQSIDISRGSETTRPDQTESPAIR